MRALEIVGLEQRKSEEEIQFGILRLDFEGFVELRSGPSKIARLEGGVALDPASCAISRWPGFSKKFAGTFAAFEARLPAEEYAGAWGRKRRNLDQWRLKD
jgi:hypothetical protein